MIETLFQGLALVVEVPTIFYLLLGIILGLWLGVVPGLGGITGLVILLPFTFGMEPTPAFALMLGMYAPVASSDTISSIMLGIPGTAASQATILDGHPLAKKGQATRALGAAYTVSAVGGVFGGLVMAVTMPLAMPLILTFGTPEFFLLGVLGLLMVGMVSGSSVSKGVGAATLGLMLSQIGYPVASEDPRYTFDLNFLLDGLPLVPVVLGLFGIPEMLDLATRNKSISEIPEEDDTTNSLLLGVKDAIQHKWLVFRCSVIGVYIGMLPGMGGAIADWIAYGHAVQSSKDKSKFGRGDIRGVIGPESANNAVAGGSLIPTLALGIPGSAGMAILLGALLIQGLSPGRQMLTEHLDLTFSMVWMLILANVIGVALLMVWGKQVAKAAFVSGHLIVPGVIIFILMGAWLSAPDILTWVTVLAVGAIGYLMKQIGWARPPLVLGFLLGPIMENAFVLSTQSFSLGVVLQRPITLILIVIIAIAFVYSVRFLKKNRFSRPNSSNVEGSGRNPVLSLPFATLLLGIFIYAGFEAQQWNILGAIFPTTIAIAGSVTMVFVIARDISDFWKLRKQAGGAFHKAVSNSFTEGKYSKSIEFLLLLAMLIGLTPLVGQYAAMLLFVGFYLWRWGKLNTWIIGIYLFGVFVVLYGLYGEILHLHFIPPIFL